MLKRRNSHDIMADILRLSGKSRTHIMFGACLSYGLTSRYLQLMEDRGFMVTRSNGSGTIYDITETGQVLLRRIESVSEMLEV